MGLSDRLLLQGLRKHLPEGTVVLAYENGSSDVLGDTRKVTAVLTENALLLATPVRARTILTRIPRSDIRTVEQVEPGVVAITFDDYQRAALRVVKLDLNPHPNTSGLLDEL